MIVGRTQSADGGFRRIPIRHTQIVDEQTRLSLVAYLKERIHSKCKTTQDWVGYRDIFPNIPEDIIDTPLKIIYDLCYKKFADDPNSLRINTAKYIGMLTREAVYYSEDSYLEQMDGSVRKYRLGTIENEDLYFTENRNKVINGSKK